MKIQVLYILDCPWCVKTKQMVKDCLRELGIKAEIEEVLIDSDEKAKKYKFAGSPTAKINGKDIQEKISKGRCLPCEELYARTKKSTNFVKKECKCGCRTYFYKNKQYSYPPKGMIKEAIKRVKLVSHPA